MCGQPRALKRGLQRENLPNVKVRSKLKRGLRLSPTTSASAKSTLPALPRVMRSARAGSSDPSRLEDRRQQHARLEVLNREAQ